MMMPKHPFPILLGCLLCTVMVFAAAAESDQLTFQHAEAILRDGKTEEAREAFQRLVESFPDSPLADDALYRLAAMDFQPGSVEELTRGQAPGAAAAFPLLDRIREEYPESDRAPDARYLQGLAHLVPGSEHYDLDRAFAAFREVVDVHPHSGAAPDSLRATAVVELRAGRPGRALLYLERLLLEHPAHEAARQGRLNAADAYLRLGLPREALVRLAPLQRQGSWPEAEAALDLGTILTLPALQGTAGTHPARLDPEFQPTEGTMRQVVDMALDGDGRLHLLAEDGRKLIRVGPSGEVESEEETRDVRALFREPGGHMGRATAEALHLSAGVVEPTRKVGAVHRLLHDVAHVAEGVDGSFYVLETRGTELLHLAPDGSFLSVLAEPGKGIAVEVDRRGWIYVLDARDKRVRRFTPDGTEQDSLFFSEEPSRVQAPAGLAVDDAYHVYVLDGKGGDLVIFGPEGRLRSRMRPNGDGTTVVKAPGALAVTGSGAVLIYDSKARVVRRLR
jgi:outer membrane protein assembly factor BamD (BamD/ComL family)